MMTILFFIALIWVVFKLFVIGMKAAWGITKFICGVFILPVVIIGLFMIGLVYIAIPVLIIVGVIALICNVAVV